MKLNDLIKKIENKYPLNLAYDWDNVGLLVGDFDNKIKKVLVTLEANESVVEEAIQKNIDLIITHHPLIFRRPSNITTDTLQGKKIIELIKNDISLYSSHTNLDSVENGLNHTIVSMLGFENSKILEKNKKDESAGLGRIVKLQEIITLEDLVEKVKKSLKVNNLRVVKGNDNISKIAIINGSGQDFISKAVSLGVDTIITGDTTYHFASDYKEMGINIIDVGHFGSEQIVFFNVMKKLKEKFDDVEFITSNVEVDPYNFY